MPRMLSNNRPEVKPGRAWTRYIPLRCLRASVVVSTTEPTEHCRCTFSLLRT